MTEIEFIHSTEVISDRRHFAPSEKKNIPARVTRDGTICVA